MEYEMLLNAGQVAQMLGLLIATIRKCVLTGFIPYRKIGRAVRFSATEVQNWAQGKSVAPSKNKMHNGE